MQSIYKVQGKTLLEKYSRQVANSQLRQRADTAYTDREICAKNIVELKSYFVSSLTSSLTPEIEKTIDWIEGLPDGAAPKDRSASNVQASDEMVASLQSMLILLSNIQEFAQLEAGICPDMPTTFEINHMLAAICGSNIEMTGNNGPEYDVEFSPEPISVMGYSGKLQQAFRNIFRFAASGQNFNNPISVLIEKENKLNLSIAIQYARSNFSDSEIKRSLNSNNLVEHIIATGVDHPRLAMPIACALIKLHSGKTTMINTTDEEVEIRIILPVYNCNAPPVISQ